MSKLISLGGKLGLGFYAVVDDEDFESVSKYSWRINPSGHVERTDNTKSWKLHRVLIKALKGQQVDHINRDKLDNRKTNLRICSYSENSQNKAKYQKNPSSKYVGVRRERSSRWVARIMKDLKYIHIGVFDTEIEAALAYNSKAQELFGKYAYVNNIEDLND